ncbi:MAG: hypothetical protein ACI9FN_003810, partial [Saprospiraceae bacterium]
LFSPLSVMCASIKALSTKNEYHPNIPILIFII